MKALSLQKRQDVIALLKSGLSVRKIAERVAVSVGMVSKIRKKDLPDAEKPLPGRPNSLSNVQERNIVRAVLSGRHDTAVDAQVYLAKHQNTHVSAQTVRNVLKKHGLKSAVKTKKPLLTPRHKRLRMEFANMYKHWTKEDWQRVIFSDETKINRFGSDGRKWCWKTPQSQLQFNHMTPTVKHGGGSLMVWGCITAFGTGQLVKINGIMNAALYCSILQEDLMDTLKLHKLKKSDVIFQHDNDPKHTAKCTKQWLKDAKIEVLEWPPQSPDLNPIENLWELFKRRLNDFPEPPSSMLQLWERVEQIWDKIEKDYCKKLIDSMPERILEVIKAKGGHTRH